MKRECDCDLRDRQWNPITGQCETCGRKTQRAKSGGLFARWLGGVQEPEEPEPELREGWEATVWVNGPMTVRKLVRLQFAFAWQYGSLSGYAQTLEEAMERAEQAHQANRGA
jgi:hypothetical protein